MSKEERRKRREARRLRRKERRARRRARRQARRANRDGSKLGQFISDKLKKVLDNEVTKIRVERGELPASAMPGDPMIKGLLAQTGSALKQSNIPIFSKVARVVPDVLDGVRQQIRLSYNLAMEHGYKGKVTPELLLFVMVESFGRKKFDTSLGQIDQARVMISEDNPKGVQNALLHLGGIISGRLIKSIVAKWVPVLGTAVSVIWDQLMVSRLKNAAATIFAGQKEVVFTPNINASDQPLSDEVAEEDEEQDIDKIYTIIQLMQADKEVSTAERQLFDQMLENADIEEEEKAEIRESLDDPIEDPEDLKLDFYKTHDEAALLLLTDLIAMAQVDERMSTPETFFISRIAQEIGFPMEEVQSMIAAKGK